MTDMQTPGIRPRARFIAFLLYGPCLPIIVMAAPPTGRTPPLLPASLDLRAPDVRHPPAISARTAALGSGIAPRLEQAWIGSADFGGTDMSERSRLAGSGTIPEMSSPMDRLIARTRREGLPIARLWESDSALLSVGFNRHGKPGVWFTKMIR